MRWIEDILLTEESVKPNALEEFSGSQNQTITEQSQGLRDAMELEGEEGESWKDQLQWVLNDDGQVHLLGAELALLPNQNSTLPIERSEETALNQLNAVGKMSHVHVTDEGYNNTGFAPGHSGDDPDHSSCPEEQAAQHGFPCLIDSVKEPEKLPTYICII